MCDELVYNADGTGKIIKRLGSFTIDGTEKFKTYDSTRTKEIAIVSEKYNEIKQPKSTKSVPIIISDILSSDTAVNVWDMAKDNIIGVHYESSENKNSLRIYSTYFSSADVAKSYFTDNPKNIIAEIETPQEIELTATEMAALKQLQTYNGVTNISNDGNADMYVKYWRDETIPSLINNTKYDDATTTKSGLMSAADKKKLDELSGGGGGSSSSTRKSIVIDIDNTTTIDIPFTINDTKNLVVYLNGILLVPSVHYTATTSQITLTGYTAMSGDIVTFVGNDNVSTSVDILATEVGIQDTANNFPDANSVENALIQLANNAKELTNANKTNVKLNTDNAMTAKLIAQSNTDYAIKQVRNIIIIPKSQADNLPQGEPGDICIVYNDE